MTPTLLYDDTCRFCVAGTRRLQRLCGGRLQLLPSRSPEAAALLGEAAPRAESQMMLAVDGRIYGGAEAVARTLMLNHWLRPVASCYYIVGLRQAADAVYRQVAARRHCWGGQCTVAPATGAAPAPNGSEGRQWPG